LSKSETKSLLKESANVLSETFKKLLDDLTEAAATGDLAEVERVGTEMTDFLERGKGHVQRIVAICRHKIMWKGDIPRA
jgi:hypothetical protein